MTSAAAEAFSVSRTMQAMEVLAFQSASAPQVAGALKVHPRTARRLLNRLVADGWLTRTEGRRRTYAPTMRIVAMAAHFAERASLPRIAAPFVAELHEESGVAAHLAIPSYNAALCLVHRAGGPEARPQLRELIPCHCTATGKVLLAYRDAWRESVLALPLERHTTRTLVDPEALRREGAYIRERGYALEDGEYQEGVRALAAPVRSADGDVVAALGISATIDELTDDRLSSLARVIVECAQAVSADLAEADGD